MKIPFATRNRGIATTTAIAAAGFIGIVTTWAALPTDAQTQRITRLTLTLHSGASPTGHVLAAVTLTCAPTGGTHPKAAFACAALTGTAGSFTTLPALHRACPGYFIPVTGSVTGTWKSRSLTFTHAYPNRCTAATRTDGVFGF